MEIQLYQKLNTAVEILDYMDRVGEALSKSGFYGVDNVNAGKTIALVCYQGGMSFMDFFRTYDLVLGKPRKKALACLAEFRAKGGKWKWKHDGSDGKKAEGDFTLEKETVSMEFTLEQAVKAQLVKKDSNWEKWPSNMLRARVISNALGILCPEIVAGPTEGKDEMEERPVKTLAESLQSKVTVAPPAETSRPSNVVDLKTTPAADDNPELKPEPKKPTAVERASAAAKADTFKAAKNEKTGKLTSETQAKIIAICGDRIEDAMTWLRAKKWLKTPDSSIGELRVERAQTIIDKPKAFIEFMTKEG